MPSTRPERSPDLRTRIADFLAAHARRIAVDHHLLLEPEPLPAVDGAPVEPLGERLITLIAAAVRDGSLDATGGQLAELRRIVLARDLSVTRLFSTVNLVERSALDELATDQELGALSDAWPSVAHLVRRGSFDVLAAYSDRTRPHHGTATWDPLTGLHSRAVFEAALAKEIERSVRSGLPLALLLVDVDQLASINRDYGHGIGDRVLERLAGMMQGHFRRYDWLARVADDALAVLLIAIDSTAARELAENLRETVRERLRFRNHRAGHDAAVTVSAAVVAWSPASGITDPERLIADGEAALRRASAGGGDRVEVLDYASRSS